MVLFINSSVWWNLRNGSKFDQFQGEKFYESGHFCLKKLPKLTIFNEKLL